MNISDKRHSMLLRAAVLLACAAPALPLPRYLIEGVYSQNTAQRFAGEGRPAVQAYLEPACLAVAPDDAVYVCVPVYSRIVRIGSDGIVRTAAGGGALSPKDGLDAATVAINASTIAVSPAGQLYFNHGGLIFRLESSGKLKLIAGGGQALPDDEGPATNAATTTVQFLTFGSDGTLYFHDLYNYRIRAVDAGGIIRTIAGASTSWPIAGPARAARVMCTGLGIDAAGNLYWATGAVSENGFVTFGLFWIFKLVRATNTIVRLDNPSATTDLRSTTSFSKLKLGEVSDLTVDSQGRIYIARSGYLDAYASDRARKALYELALFRLDPVSDAIEHVAGNGGRGWATSGDALKTPLARPTRVAVNSKGAVWFIDHAAIKKVQAGLLSWVGGAFSGPAVGEDGDVSAAQLHTIQDIAYSQSGELHFSDKATHTVWKIDSQNRLRRVAGNGIPNFSGDGGPATQASLFQPWGVCFDSSNNLYIADKYNGRIRKVTPSGIISTVAGDLGGKADPDGGSANLHTLIAPMHCAGDRNGNIYYVQSNGGGYLVDLSEGQVVYRLSPAGTATRMTAFQYAPGDFDGKPARDAFLQGPRGMAFDSKGNLYITERRNSRIRKVSPEGIITTFAGGGPKADDFGDNGPATSADLNYPDDVAVDAEDNVFIYDNGHFRVRRVDASGRITTVAGGGTGPANTPEATLACLALPEWNTWNGPYDWGLKNGPNGTLVFNSDWGIQTLKPGRLFSDWVLNGATFRQGPVAPGEIVTIYGDSVGPASMSTASYSAAGQLPTDLGGASFTFDGVPAPIVYASSNVASVIVPYGVGGTTKLQARYGQLTNLVTLDVAAASPGIFTMAGGAGQIAAFNANPDGSGGYNSSSNPVQPGGWLIFFLTGQGRVTPALADGQLPSGPQFPVPIGPVTVSLGNVRISGADVWTGLTYQGVLQVNVKVPPGIPAATAVPIMVSVGSAWSPQGTTVALAASAAVSACVALPQGARQFWTADGDPQDLISYHLAYFKDGARYSPGMVGQAFDFSSPGSAAEVGDGGAPNPTSQLTLELWVRRSAIAGPVDPIMKKSSATTPEAGGYSLEFAGEQVAFHVYSNANGWSHTPGVQFSLNAWTHLAAVFDGSRIMLYINGDAVAGPVAVTGPLLAGAGQLQFARDLARPDRSFQGQMDEITVYDRALNAAEMRSIYLAGPAGKCRPR